MSILSGYKKVKDYILTSTGYQLLSRWTNANTVEADDGKTLQTKVGAINGIAKTYNEITTTTDSSFAASATAVKEGFDSVNGKLTWSVIKFSVAPNEWAWYNYAQYNEISVSIQVESNSDNDRFTKIVIPTIELTDNTREFLMPNDVKIYANRNSIALVAGGIAMSILAR